MSRAPDPQLTAHLSSPPATQGLFNGKLEGQLPALPRPKGPGYGAVPVYTPGGLQAQASHVVENAVEYGPEITGPAAGAAGQPPAGLPLPPPPGAQQQPPPSFAGESQIAISDELTPHDR